MMRQIEESKEEQDMKEEICNLSGLSKGVQVGQKTYGAEANSIAPFNNVEKGEKKMDSRRIL